MVETLSELLENAANVAEDNGGKLSIASEAARSPARRIIHI